MEKADLNNTQKNFSPMPYSLRYAYYVSIE